MAPRLLVDKLAEAPPRSRLEGAALDADVRRRPARDALVRVADQIPASEERGQYDATCVSERERAARGEGVSEVSSTRFCLVKKTGLSTPGKNVLQGQFGLDTTRSDMRGSNERGGGRTEVDRAGEHACARTVFVNSRDLVRL